MVGTLSFCFYDISLRQDKEYIAAILVQNGNYTVQVQAGHKNNDRIRLKIYKRSSQTLVALWHTHGSKGLARSYFSRTDTELSNKLKVPIYLTNPEEEIRRYDPGTRVIKMGGKVKSSNYRIPRGSAAGFLVSSNFADL